jgi:hypothetical protein
MKYFAFLLFAFLGTSLSAHANERAPLQARCASNEYAVATVQQTGPNQFYTSYQCKAMLCVYVKSFLFPVGPFSQKYDIYLKKENPRTGSGFIEAKDLSTPNNPDRLASRLEGKRALFQALQGFISRGVCKRAVDRGSVDPEL